MAEVDVIWMYTTLGDATPQELEDHFKGKGFTVEFREEFVDNEERHHIIFTLKDNIGEFAIYRLSDTSLKWLDDYAYNHWERIPEWVVVKYGLKEEWEDGKENN